MAVVRQKLHLAHCADFPSHLSSCGQFSAAFIINIAGCTYRHGQGWQFCPGADNLRRATTLMRWVGLSKVSTFCHNRAAAPREHRARMWRLECRAYTSPVICDDRDHPSLSMSGPTPLVRHSRTSSRTIPSCGRTCWTTTIVCAATSPCSSMAIARPEPDELAHAACGSHVVPALAGG
jgi:hypothetical protein